NYHLSFFFLIIPRHQTSTLFPYTTLFRSNHKNVHSELYVQTALSFDVVEPYGKKDQEKTSRITLSLVRWLIIDQQPFSLMDNNRSEEHTSELQSQSNLVCRLLLEKKKKKN